MVYNGPTRKVSCTFCPRIGHIPLADALERHSWRLHCCDAMCPRCAEGGKGDLVCALCSYRSSTPSTSGQHTYEERVKTKGWGWVKEGLACPLCRPIPDQEQFTAKTHVLPWTLYAGAFARIPPGMQQTTMECRGCGATKLMVTSVMGSPPLDYLCRTCRAKRMGTDVESALDRGTRNDELDEEDGYGSDGSVPNETFADFMERMAPRDIELDDEGGLL